MDEILEYYHDIMYESGQLVRFKGRIYKCIVNPEADLNFSYGQTPANWDNWKDVTGEYFDRV